MQECVSFHPFLPMAASSSGHQRFDSPEDDDAGYHLRVDENCVSIWSFAVDSATNSVDDGDGGADLDGASDEKWHRIPENSSDFMSMYIMFVTGRRYSMIDDKANPLSALIWQCWTHGFPVRGEDAWRNFIQFLYESLTASGIYAFIDHDGIEIGEEIMPKILKLSGTQRCIPIFYKDFASSKSWLQEVETVMEYRTIGPIFYNVRPSVVSKQQEIISGPYATMQPRGWSQRL